MFVDWVSLSAASVKSVRLSFFPGTYTALMWPKPMLGWDLFTEARICFILAAVAPSNPVVYLTHVFAGYLPLRGFPNHFFPGQFCVCLANLRLGKSLDRRAGQCQSTRIRRVARVDILCRSHFSGKALASRIYELVAS